MKRDNLHLDFEMAFRDQIGNTLSKREMKEILQRIFPGFPDGSVVPTDHAAPTSNHVNQCRKCANPDYQIFDTVIDGHGKSGIVRYRVRDFKPFPLVGLRVVVSHPSRKDKGAARVRHPDFRVEPRGKT